MGEVRGVLLFRGDELGDDFGELRGDLRTAGECMRDMGLSLALLRAACVLALTYSRLSTLVRYSLLGVFLGVFGEGVLRGDLNCRARGGVASLGTVFSLRLWAKAAWA